MELRCSCDPAKELFSAGCVYGDPQPTPPGCARVVVCRVATSPYKCSSEYHHIAETDMRGVNVLTFDVFYSFVFHPIYVSCPAPC